MQAGNTSNFLALGLLCHVRLLGVEVGGFELSEPRRHVLDHLGVGTRKVVVLTRVLFVA